MMDASMQCCWCELAPYKQQLQQQQQQRQVLYFQQCLRRTVTTTPLLRMGCSKQEYCAVNQQCMGSPHAEDPRHMRQLNSIQTGVLPHILVSSCCCDSADETYKQASCFVVRYSRCSAQAVSFLLAICSDHWVQHGKMPPSSWPLSNEMELVMSDHLEYSTSKAFWFMHPACLRQQIADLCVAVRISCCISKTDLLLIIRDSPSC